MKSRLSSLLSILGLCSGGSARALDIFECVHALLPITEQAAFQSKRSGIEKPFMLSEKYMAFPEVSAQTVTGFYIYAQSKAWYYDAIEEQGGKGVSQALSALNATTDQTLYEMVAQPSGIETVTVRYMPSFRADETISQGPTLLGASVLPVIGAFVSRSNTQAHLVYHNPSMVDERDLKQWIYNHSSRKPAAVGEIAISHKMMRLTTRVSKDRAALWRPLFEELKIRKLWVQTHNLDVAAFRDLSHILQTTCRE